MGKPPFKIQFQHQPEDFWALHRDSTCATERRRAQFFALLAEGQALPDVLKVTKYSVPAAYLIARRYKALGLAGLKDGRRNNPGAPRLLTESEQQALTARLQEDAGKGVFWDGKKVQAWIKQEFGKEVYLGRAYEFMRAAGTPAQRSRSRQSAPEPAEQKEQTQKKA